MAYGNLSLSPNRCNSAHRDWKHEQGLHSVISLEIRVSATPSCAPETLSSKLEAALQVQAQQLFPKYDWEPRFRILSIRLSNSSPSKPQSREGEAERTRSTAQQRDQHIDNASESPMGRDRIDAPNEDDADQNGLTNARSGASILPTIEVSTTATNEGGSSNSVDRITKEDELLGADKVSMRARQIQRKLLEQIRDGATNFRHNAQTRLGWEDSVELLKPTLKTWPLSVLQERFVRYSQVLGFRKWLTDFLHACATLCAVGDPATSSNITIIRKFVYCVVEPINRLYPIMGNDAFHIITALGGKFSAGVSKWLQLILRLAASQPFTKTFAKSCNWDDLVPAVAKLVSQLSKDISWSKLGSQHLIDLPSFLEGPQLR